MIHDVVILGALILLESLLQVLMRELSDSGLTVSMPIGTGTSIIVMMRRVAWLDLILPNRF